MDGWPLWLTGIVLLVAAAFAARQMARRRRRRVPRRIPRSSRPAVPAQRPRAGEIWWADVPYEDGAGSKVRPCLVLRTGSRHLDVLKITSQDKRDRADHVRLPTTQWDPRAERDSSLDVLSPIRVRPRAFVRRAGTCDPTVWRAVRKVHGIRSTT
jgi:hypothetical protein